VGLGTLGILSDLAPVAVVADDLHWLDRATADTLAFVARRLPAQGVAVLAATRGCESLGRDELALGPLDERASAALLASSAQAVDPAVRARLLACAAGNPLALIELPKTADQVDGTAASPSSAPLSERLEQSFTARVASLPPATGALLLVAALDGGGALDEILRAGGHLLRSHVTSEQLMPAVTGGFLDLDEAGLRFRHPLMRAAIRQAAGMSRRQSAHAALAEVVADRDRRVWHRAAAALGADERLAAELTSAAARAHRRGGTASALVALQRAADLSVDRGARSERLLRAAELSLEMGRRRAVRELLDDVEPQALSIAQRGRLAWVRDVLDEHRSSPRANVEATVAVAERLQAEGEAEAATNVLLTAAQTCWRAGTESTAGELIVAAADRLGLDDERLLAIHGFATPSRRAAEVIARLGARGPDVAADPEAVRVAGTVLSALGAFDCAGPFLRAARDRLRAQGRRGLLARCLVSLAWTELAAGDARAARSTAAEAAGVARETQQVAWTAAAQLAEAAALGLCGETDAAEELVASAERSVVPTAAGWMLAHVQIARGTIALGAGRYLEAYEQLHRIYDPADAAHHPLNGAWAVFDLAEAAVHSGRRADARAVAADLERAATATSSPLLVAALACARPLLADDDAAGPLFDDALGSDLGPWPLMRSRLLLAYGSWLRRRRRVVESRGPLRAAGEAFEALGAASWAERASQELRATGQTTRRRAGDDRDQLSPQELEIALMAAQGLTNRQIGQRLYLSHRTVGAHLYRTFPKLGISSRFELAAALEDVPRPQVAHAPAPSRDRRSSRVQCVR
jgi:DNA-binding CsgD family transcriptional regulator